MTPLVLAALAVVLAGPLPALLARLPVVRRTPVAALVLWQSIAAAAVLAALGAGFALVTQHAWTGTSGLTTWVVAGVSLGVTLLVAARLLWSAHRVGTSLRALRRRHRHQLDLVANAGGRVHVIEHDVPVAYCIPGFGRERIVISEGARGVLSDEELDAVLEHERAHLRARHDLVLEAFSALREAFPRWVSSDAALREVRLLVEVLADRVAARASDRRALGRALVHLAEGRAPEAALGAGGSSVARSAGGAKGVGGPGGAKGAGETGGAGGSSDAKVVGGSEGAGAAGGVGGRGEAAAVHGRGEPAAVHGLLARVELLADPRPRRLQATLLSALALGLLVLPTAFVVVPWLTTLAP